MKKTIILKQLLAIILLSTFFLPLSRCDIQDVNVKVGAELPGVSAKNKKKTVTDAPKFSPPGSDRKSFNYSYNLPYKMFYTKEFFSWLMFLAFVWPFPLLAYIYFGRRKKILNILTLIEPFFCLGSMYMVGMISLMGEIMYGGYLALGSIFSYFIVSCYDIFMMIKKYIKNRKLEQGYSR
jgi:hypothetical protein